VRESGGRSSPRARILLACILAATAWGYRGDLALGFTDADALASVASARVDGVGDLMRQVWQPVTGGVAGSNADFWRPVAMLHFALLRACFGWAPLGYQVWDLALHLGVASLVFVLVRASRRSEGEALVAAALAGLHPLGVEIVPAVARNIELLFCVFGLATLVAVVRGRILLAALLGMLTLGSKETGVVFLPAAVVLALAEGDRRGARMLVTTWLVGIPLYLLGRVAVLGSWGGYGSGEFPLARIVPTLRAGPLEILFPGWTPQLERWISLPLGTALSLLLLGAATWGAVTAWRRGNRLPAVGLVLVLAPLLLYALTATYTRRLLYVPVLGVSIACAGAIEHGRLRWLLGAWALSLVPASPAFFPDRDWARNDAITTGLTEGIREQLAALPPSALLWVVDLPLRVDHDPRRRMLWRQGWSVNNTLAPYSLRAWLDDRLGRPDLQVRFFGRPRDVGGLDRPDVQVEKGAIRIRRQPFDRRWSARLPAWNVVDEGEGLVLRRTLSEGASPRVEAGEWMAVCGVPVAVLVPVPF
jgi:hypothetical protein